MIYSAIVLFCIGGVASAILARREKNPAVMRRCSRIFLILGCAGAIAAVITAILLFSRTTDMPVVQDSFILLIETAGPAVLFCLAVVLIDLFSRNKKRTVGRLLPVLLPFFWAVPILWWTALCALWSDYSVQSAVLYIKAEGIALCFLLFFAPAAYFSRCADADALAEAEKDRNAQHAKTKEKRVARAALQAKKKRLRHGTGKKN